MRRRRVNYKILWGLRASPGLFNKMETSPYFFDPVVRPKAHPPTETHFGPTDRYIGIVHPNWVKRWIRETLWLMRKRQMKFLNVRDRAYLNELRSAWKAREVRSGKQENSQEVGQEKIQEVGQGDGGSGAVGGELKQ